MKRIFFLIILFIVFLFQTCAVFAEPSKVMSLNYDDNSALVYLNIMESSEGLQKEFKYSKLENPNRIYFDIENSVLIGGKQQLIFEKSNIKEIKLSQFTTNPDVVRAVITFEEGVDTSKIKLINVNGNIVVKCGKLALTNDYFNPIYEEKAENLTYSSVAVNSQVVQKVTIPQNTVNASNSVIADIQQAFENSTLNNSDGKTYDSVVSIDLSSDLKLRTKYYINGYYIKNGGLLVSGLGQITASKMFYLDSPKRVVIDIPNTFVDTKIRNKELKICPDGSCKDVSKIGQFEYNKARLVVTTDKPEKYIPVFSADAQSLLFINADKLKHTDLVNCVANLGKGYVRKIDNKTNELILSFTNPVVHSILRDDKGLNIYLFNVKSYNELDLIKTLQNTYYKELTFSLLPQIGVRASMSLNESDVVKIDQSVDGKAIKITITQGGVNVKDTPVVTAPVKKPSTKGKVVLDAGHGGSDYGAIREGINEKDITLDVTQRVASILKSKGYKVALTRVDDKYVSLQERVEFSENEAPEIFVSIHVNSAVAVEPKGIETHYYHDYSKELAKTVHAHLIKGIDTKDRGLFKSKFYVINHTTVPAILVEMGFISNDEERAALVTDSRKQKTAKAIAEGIIEYIKSQQSK